MKRKERSEPRMLILILFVWFVRYFCPLTYLGIAVSVSNWVPIYDSTTIANSIPPFTN